MPGTKFRKEDLTVAVTAMFDGLIDKHQAKLDYWASKTDAEIIDAWRREQSDKVIAFAKRLEDPDDIVDDHELGAFETTIKPYRERDYEVRYARDQITALTRKKDKAIHYSKALAADETGVVEVFAADMRRLGLDD